MKSLSSVKANYTKPGMDCNTNIGIIYGLRNPRPRRRLGCGMRRAARIAWDFLELPKLIDVDYPSSTKQLPKAALFAELQNAAARDAQSLGSFHRRQEVVCCHAHASYCTIPGTVYNRKSREVFTDTNAWIPNGLTTEGTSRDISSGRYWARTSDP